MMARKVKLVSLILCGLAIYAFIGGVAYGGYLKVYPRQHESAVAVGVIWPIGVPYWGALEAGLRISNIGASVFGPDS